MIDLDMLAMQTEEILKDDSIFNVIIKNFDQKIN